MKLAKETKLSARMEDYLEAIAIINKESSKD